MANYKLRLGDGTELLVDGNSLHTWTADDNAKVQTRSGWRPLREVLAAAQERSSSRAAAAQGEKPPPPMSELPSLKLRDTDDEPVDDADLYDGDEYYDDG